MSRRNIGGLVLAVPAVVGLAALGDSDASWFPQQYAHEFYLVKGIVGIVAVVLLLVHMSTTWPRVGSRDQQLRYIALLVVTVLIASSSKSQFSDSSPVQGANIGGLLAALIVTVSMVVSIRHDRRRPSASPTTDGNPA